MIYAKSMVYKLLKLLIDRKFYSQATQDIFVLEMLLGKKNGFYLEIGGGDPSDSNNTFLLEKDYGWTGLSIEFNKELVEIYNKKRSNKAFCADATKFDYNHHLSALKASKKIDYLSLDIDPAENTLIALKNLPHEEYRFSIITYEHDRYQSGEIFMEESRSFLKGLGYKLVVENLNVFGKDFEDWWVDPTSVPENIWESFNHSNIEFIDLWI